MLKHAVLLRAKQEKWRESEDEDGKASAFENAFSQYTEEHVIILVFAELHSPHESVCLFWTFATFCIVSEDPTGWVVVFADTGGVGIHSVPVHIHLPSGLIIGPVMT